VHPAEEELQKKASMRTAYEEFQRALFTAESILVKAKKTHRAYLENDLANFQQSIKDMRVQFSTSAPFKSEGLTNEKAFAMLDNFTEQLRQKRAKEAEFADKLELFLVDTPQYKELELIDLELQNLKTIWTRKSEWDDWWLEKKEVVFTGIDTEDMEDSAAKYQKVIVRLKKDMLNWPVWQCLKAELDVFRTMMPLITDLRHPAMRDRHWETIQAAVSAATGGSQPFDPNGSDFTMAKIFDLELNVHAEIIEEQCDNARKEYKIETSLKEIREIWAVMVIDVVQYKNDYFRLRSTEDFSKPSRRTSSHSRA